MSRKLVKAKACSGLATDSLGLSDACAALLKDEGLLRSVRRVRVSVQCPLCPFSFLLQKNNESELPEKEQHDVQVKRDKYSSALSLSADERQLSAHMQDPLFFAMWNHLERGKSTACFLHLYQHALDGKLQNSSTFTELCQVLAERVRRDTSPNKKLKYGMRYPENYLNFMTLMRSYGGNSARQFAILTGELAGPSPRTMR